MQITMDNPSECDVLSYIVEMFSNGKAIKKDDKTKKIFLDLKEAVDRFHINNIDKIGPMWCKSCFRKWTAIVSLKSDIIECPFCNSENTINKGSSKCE